MPSDTKYEITCEFHVGDIVVPKPGAPYGVTTNGWVGQVESVGKSTITCIAVCNTNGTPAFGGRFSGLAKRHFEVI